MKNSDILKHTRHRPIPMPSCPWVMKQVWNDLLFAHWPIDEGLLLPHIPQGLTLQKWEGRPWISLSPFVLNPLRLRGLPPVPLTRRFLELNVRTYVEKDGYPGIFFFSLEASNGLAVAGARVFAHLPYRLAEMDIAQEGNAFRYNSSRNRSSAVFSGIYGPDDPSVFHAEPGTLTHWLTERYCLFAAGPGGRLYRGDIHHLPWPLQKASLSIETNTLTNTLGLVHDRDPSLLTYTKRLEVLLWPLKKV